MVSVVVEQSQIVPLYVLKILTKESIMQSQSFNSRNYILFDVLTQLTIIVVDVVVFLLYIYLIYRRLSNWVGTID